MANKICSNFVCISCVDGSCPIANIDEYQERGYPVVFKCEDCYIFSRSSCKDCDLFGTDNCAHAD